MKEHENEIFLVHYDKWCSLNEIDLEQNYFAIDDPYNDEDYRLLWLQNTIKDITPPGEHFYVYEDAVEALYNKEREIANLPFNKENNIGSYMVLDRKQLKMIMEARALKKHERFQVKPESLENVSSCDDETLGKYADLLEYEVSVKEYLDIMSLFGYSETAQSVEELMEVFHYVAEIWNYDISEKNHCLEEDIPVLLVKDDKEQRMFEVPEESVDYIREQIKLQEAKNISEKRRKGR